MLNSVLGAIWGVVRGLLASGILGRTMDPEEAIEAAVLQTVAIFGVKLESGFLSKLVAWAVLHRDDPSPPDFPPEFMHSPALVANEDGTFTLQQDRQTEFGP